MAAGKYKEYLTEEGLAILEGWARDGLTDEQIAKNIGIRRPTLYSWKKSHHDISDALKRGKEVVDRQVEGSLLRRAKGISVTEKQFKVVDRNEDQVKVERREYEHRYALDHPEATKQEIVDAAIKAVNTRERIQIYETVKELPSDTTAGIFWLKNRRPDIWRDRKETQLSGGLGISSEFQKLSEEELRKLANDEDA